MKVAQHDQREMEEGEQLWLNRHLVQAAFRQATGKPCFRSPHACFDAVLVSDAGKEFKIVANARAGGMIATSMRASDILMDRVWQLETDTFSGTSGFVFAPISKCIEPEEDSTAAHPEIQRRAAEIRTDLDRFSPLEISALIRHGYCVCRSACRSRPDLFGATIPADPPWDPMASSFEKAPRRVPSGKITVPSISPATQQSRTLQNSAVRRIWSTLLDYRDWISYLYVPLLVPILIILPYYCVKWYQQSQVAQRLVESMAQSNRDYDVMRTLLQEGPTPPFEGMPAEEVLELTPVEYSGFEVIGDMRVLDCRSWNLDSKRVGADQSWTYGYRRIRLQKLEPNANRFALLLRMPRARLDVRSMNQHVPTVLHHLREVASEGNRPLQLFEVDFDLSKIPAHEVVDLTLEFGIRDLDPIDMQSVKLYVDAETGLLSCWLLLPEGSRYQSFDVLRYSTEKGSTPETITPAHRLNPVDHKLLAFSLLSVKPEFIYECRWTYAD